MGVSIPPWLDINDESGLAAFWSYYWCLGRKLHRESQRTLWLSRSPSRSFPECPGINWALWVFFFFVFCFLFCFVLFCFVLFFFLSWYILHIVWAKEDIDMSWDTFQYFFEYLNSIFGWQSHQKMISFRRGQRTANVKKRGSRTFNLLYTNQYIVIFFPAEVKCGFSATLTVKIIVLLCSWPRGHMLQRWIPRGHLLMSCQKKGEFFEVICRCPLTRRLTFSGVICRCKVTKKDKFLVVICRCTVTRRLSSLRSFVNALS